MGLPRKGSRRITIDGADYRWLVTVRRGSLHLTVEAEEPGQRLVSHFRFHDEYQDTGEGGWRFHHQGRRITSGVVKRVIAMRFEKGWRPREQGLPALELMEAEWALPVPPEPVTGEEAPTVRLKEIADDAASEWLLSVSLDPEWRQRLFQAPVHQRFALPADEQHGLHYQAFSDERTDDGWVVFGVECVEFPDVVHYSTNPSCLLNNSAAHGAARSQTGSAQRPADNGPRGAA
jgi:hypothetical protein